MDLWPGNSPDWRRFYGEQWCYQRVGGHGKRCELWSTQGTNTARTNIHKPGLSPELDVQYGRVNRRRRICTVNMNSLNESMRLCHWDNGVYPSKVTFFCFIRLLKDWKITKIPIWFTLTGNSGSCGLEHPQVYRTGCHAYVIQNDLKRKRKEC